MEMTWGGGAVIKDDDGKLVTERTAIMKLWEGYFKELLNQEETAASRSCCLI